MADVTDVGEREDEEPRDDTDPGRGSVEWTAPGSDPLATRPTPKHKRPKVKEERAPREGSLLGAFAGLLVVLLIGSNVLLWVRSEDTNDASGVARVAAAQKQLADQLDTLQASVEDLKGSVSTVQQSVANTSTAPIAEQLAALQTRTDNLAACINTYMDALAAWSRNIASTFVYTKC